jgi:succinyl-diaminopimelate desuccinylase
MPLPEPLSLAQALIRCPSITPEDAGALDVLTGALEPLGFVCRRLRYADEGTAPVDNLYARLGSGAPHLTFAGHTDVVPPGDRAAWSADPFAADVRDGRLYGRGAADMKAAIACFVAAVGRFVAVWGGAPEGSISLLITGDEEGDAVNGTVKALRQLAGEGERFDACLVGEPTNPDRLGEMAKIGRRGSLNATITVDGEQGHAAYPERADNPVARLVRMLAAIDGTPLDDGSRWFQPSTVAITSVDVGNPARNVTPARARAFLNVRFNDRHSGDGVRAWLDAQCKAVGGRYTLATVCSGEAFLSPPGPLSDLIVDAALRVTGRRPQLSTSGGTSDARFIKDYAPVIEFGLTSATAHKVDEHVAVSDIEALTDIYVRVLTAFFARAKDN